MISDFDSFYASDPPSSSWGKVTRRIVDPITFSCRVNVTYVPRIEDCSYETTNIAIGHPQFGGEPPLPTNGKNNDVLRSASASRKSDILVSPSASRKSGLLLVSPTASRKSDGLLSPSESRKSKVKEALNDAAWTTSHDFTPPTTSIKSPTPIKSSARNSFKSPTRSSTKSPSKQSSSNKSPAKSPAKNMVKPTKSGGEGPKAASLALFFSKASEKDAGDIDNQSLSSRSMNSRSVSELSNAERSKSEEKLKSRRAKNKMMAIDEQSVSDFPEKKESKGENPPSKGGTLGNFLDNKEPPSAIKVEDDNRSLMSASTIGSKVSRMSSADRSKYEKKLKSARGAKPHREEKSKTAVSGEPVVEHEPLVEKRRKKPSTSSTPLKSILKKESSGSSANKGRKLEIKDGHDMMEMPTLDDKDYYRDWDDIWYSEEELGDMRYEAFLEEAGLDVDEYLDMG
jgi:hypothetical protein